MPSKEKFHSSLSGKSISDKEYEFALKIETMKTMRKIFHDLYLKWDDLLLADELEKFENNGFKNYGLCSCHYFSVPGLGWDAMLKITKVDLEFKEVQEAEFIIFLIDRSKPTISIQSFMIQNVAMSKSKLCNV